jgi:hypothetical protein
MQKIQATLAASGGDIWRSWRMLALWPYPAVILGVPSVHFTADDYRCFTRLLQPGDILLTRSEPFFISNYFIGKNGTAFSHAGVYTGPVQGYRCQNTGFIMKPKPIQRTNGWESSPGVFKRTVTHAISEGVVCQDLLEMLFHADWVAAVRPWANHGEGFMIQKVALDQVGLEYNFDFKPSGPPAMYCTELAAYCIEATGIPTPPKDWALTSLPGAVLPFRRFKSLVTLADAFIRYPMVCCSVSCNNPRFTRRSKFDKMRECLLNAPDATRYARG